jgi:hypothetical protein
MLGSSGVQCKYRGVVEMSVDIMKKGLRSRAGAIKYMNKQRKREA